MRPTLTLAGPVVSAELGSMAMAVVDLAFVGHLGAEAIGAVGLGNMAFWTPSVFGFGLMLGLDTVVARSFGADDLVDCRRSLVQGLYLSALATVVVTLGVVGAGLWLRTLKVAPEVLREAGPYLRALNFGVAPMLVFVVFRRYLQATGRVAAVVGVLVSANLVNALGNYVFIYGHFGAPALGVIGSGWSTTASRVYMVVALGVYTLWREYRYGGGFAGVSFLPDLGRIRALLALGLPAALHVTLEVGVFGAATALAGHLDTASLAVHEVVLNIASVTFMVPFGLATAGAVRVGQALGRNDPEGAARAGWTTLALGVAFMAASGLAFCLMPGIILRAFTDDARVLKLGVGLLYVAAGFQLFDGIQGVTTGNLRGAGDTRTPMYCNLVTHWLLGLPVGYLLAFHTRLGVLGLWLGLSTGLVAAGCVLLRAWVLRTRGAHGGVVPAAVAAG